MKQALLQRTVDDIVGGYRDLEAPEERKERRVEGSLLFRGFETLLTMYERFLSIQHIFLPEAYERIAKTNKRVLTPERVNTFLQAAIRYEQHRNYSICTGPFISSLIQNSYNAGHNDFHLNAKAAAEPLSFIGYMLEGKRKEPIRVLIEGSAGSLCGGKAECLDCNTSRFTFYDGDPEDNSFDVMVTRYCDFHSELFGDNCGNLARHCSFTGREFGNDCGYRAKQCSFTGEVFGNGCGSHAYECIFKTSSEESVRRLMASVEKGRRNK
ncbi:MAG: hypothetical protein QMD85_04045, partial [Candidatus Aenigmarchaeota archaeon]|nr:hypothetical protein [Candidatus Aenigmarchaeota archaeon]MDI6722733.1 hypothetical protein [Candidatus Aenigmarchaeota archaeon]